MEELKRARNSYGNYSYSSRAEIVAWPRCWHPMPSFSSYASKLKAGDGRDHNGVLDHAIIKNKIENAACEVTVHYGLYDKKLKKLVRSLYAS